MSVPTGSSLPGHPAARPFTPDLAQNSAKWPAAVVALPLPDPNPGRSIPLGGRSYPAGAAGTITPSGVVLSGDDAPAWRRAGYTVQPMTVWCSAKLAHGDALPSDPAVIAAIDCNGRPRAEVAALLHGLAIAGEYLPAAGVYDGAEAQCILVMLLTEDIIHAHDRLLVLLKGFGCFAAFTPREVAP